MNWTIDLDGLRLYCESVGEGKALILVPGFASGMWSWAWQADLAKKFRLITFDPSGIGRSQPADKSPLAGLSMMTFVSDVLKVLDALEIEKASMLGASFGGFVAQEFAIQHPDRINKLILACTTAGGKEHIRPDIAILRSFIRDPDRPLGEQIRRFFRPAFTEKFNIENAEVVEEVCRLREQNDVAEETYLAQLHSAFSFDTSSRLGEISHETLVITGDKDKLVPVQNSINLAAKLPEADLKIIENGSHMIFVENAGEFNRIVSEFVGH